MKNKESRLLLMPDGPNKGRAKVGRLFALVSLVLLLQGNVESCPFHQALVTLVPSHHITKTFTRFTSVTSPFQPACLSSRCFHWPSLPSGSPITCCTASLGTPFSGNDLFLFPPNPSWRLKEHLHVSLPLNALLFGPVTPGVSTTASVFCLVKIWCLQYVNVQD